MLEGGTIAEGVRPAETEADHLMAEALFYESVAQAYGWPPDVVDGQPYELLQRMLQVSAIRNEVEESKAKKGLP